MRHVFRSASGLAMVAASVLYTQGTAAATSSGFRILHHESVRVTSAKGVGVAERMSFTAYGRHFDLDVEPNERIRRGLPAGVSSSTVPLAGTVQGLSGSWVRVTRSATGLRGMLFDGHDMYAIQPASEAAAVAVQPLNAADGDTVVYRLSDALMPVETMKCEVAHANATPESPATAADAFRQLTSELSSYETGEASLSKQVRVGVVADYEFSTQFATSTPEDAIVARMNIVDGIFGTQLGVKILLSTPTVFRASSDPFTKSNASELLAELKTYRSGSSAQQQNGITHLMTGRDLDTTTVGIAYIGGICEAEFGASLSQSGLNTTQAALIAAHEIGHNFGAPHDGENACASTPQTFLMAPQLNGSDQFSACSVTQIQQTIATTRAQKCVTPYLPADVSVSIPPAGVSGVVGSSLVASFTVVATGSDASMDVAAAVTVPAGLTVTSAAANGGTCTVSASSVNCTLGTLARDDSRQIDLNITPSTAGSQSLAVSVQSTNDQTTSNNSGTIPVTVSASSNASTTPPATGGSTSSSGGGGGGGRLDLSVLALLGLASLLAVARRRLRGSARGLC